jgi:hypothetical protein
MATYSEVKSGLDAIAGIISAQRQVMIKVKSNAGTASVALAAVQADYADVLATINGYGSTNAAEALAKADLAKLTTEFLALKGKADAIGAVDLNS